MWVGIAALVRWFHFFKMDPLNFWRENADFFNRVRSTEMEDGGKWKMDRKR
jgi:hypothetical protein